MTRNRDAIKRPPGYLAVAGFVLVGLLGIGAVLVSANSQLELLGAFASVATWNTLFLLYGDRG